MRRSERRKSRQEQKRADAGRRRFLKHATIASLVLSNLNNALGIFDRLWSWRPAARVAPTTFTAAGTSRVVGVGAALQGKAFLTMSATGTLTDS